MCSLTIPTCPMKSCPLFSGHIYRNQQQLKQIVINDINEHVDYLSSSEDGRLSELEDKKGGSSSEKCKMKQASFFYKTLRAFLGTDGYWLPCCSV